MQRHSTRELPPAIVVGGAINGLSVARCLGRRGIPVFAINPPGDPCCYSHWCRYISETGHNDDDVADYLLGPRSDWLAGGVLLACNDAMLQLLSRNKNELAAKFRLDLCNPSAQGILLDKLATYQAAKECGVATPRYWQVEHNEDIHTFRAELVYPLLIKPLLSHEYRKVFRGKFVLANNFDETLQAFSKLAAANVPAMLVEQIPGPDDLLCSYYTYLDEQDRPLFDFTKRVIRRYPVGSGYGCYHITDWLPELREPSLRLFRQVGLRGLGNVEYKRDPRDGQLKLIECNARFTGGNGLVADSGYDLASFVYNRILGLPTKPFGKFQIGKRLWYPVEDFHAFRQLRKRGEITWWQWLKSIAHFQTLPYLRWYDPWPGVVSAGKIFAGTFGSLMNKIYKRFLGRADHNDPAPP